MTRDVRTSRRHLHSAAIVAIIVGFLSVRCASYAIAPTIAAPASSIRTSVAVDAFWGMFGGASLTRLPCGGGVSYAQVSTPFWGWLVSLLTIGTVNFHNVAYRCANTQDPNATCVDAGTGLPGIPAGGGRQ